MKKYVVIFSMSIICFACKKAFLEAKPNSSILVPTTLSEYQSLLDNSQILNQTAGLPQLSSDEYFILDRSSFDALGTETARNAYLWKKDLYKGASGILDWNQPYQAVFYANSVLDGIKNIPITPLNQVEWNNIKGEALFFRALAFSDLSRNFCSIYNEISADHDLGIPLRMSADIDIILQRASLKDTYARIIQDLNESLNLLKDNVPTFNRNRPSKAAVYALLSRIYLYMGKYSDAAISSNSCLSNYNSIIDYNGVDTISEIPFGFNTNETILYTSQIFAYGGSTGYTEQTEIGVDPELIKLYDSNDLRLPLFFLKNSVGNYNVKRGYVGEGYYPFTGLAVDEVMLIKAECAARANNPQLSIDILNQLLVNRYKKGTFVRLNSMSSKDALSLVLLERRKELVWRALRWFDVKRLNKEGSNIILKRVFDGIEYTLQPNSPLFVFPIPSDEITLSGIEQNIR
jgi:hypothetical protein